MTRTRGAAALFAVGRDETGLPFVLPRVISLRSPALGQPADGDLGLRVGDASVAGRGERFVEEDEANLAALFDRRAVQRRRAAHVRVDARLEEVELLADHARAETDRRAERAEVLGIDGDARLLQR